MMKSCRSGLWPDISFALGEIAIEPSGKVTLEGSAEPMTEARVACRRTYGAEEGEEVLNVNRRWPTREAEGQVSRKVGRKKANYALALISARTAFSLSSFMTTL